MNCVSVEKQAEQYVHNELTPDERNAFESHVNSCPSCQHLISMILEENKTLTETLYFNQSALPVGFTENILDQLTPYPVQGSFSQMPPAAQHKKQKTMRNLFVSAAAALLLVFTTSAFISPTFAAFLSSFITRVGGELGLKTAAEQGYSNEVNKVVSDKGISLHVREIIADPNRLVVTYLLKDKDGKNMEDLAIPRSPANKIYVTDQAGNIITESHNFSRGADYADLTFALTNPPNNLVVHLNITELNERNPVKGTWKLDAQVDISKSIAATNRQPIQAVYTSPSGIAFTLENVTYTPSATRLDILTRETPAEKERVRKMAAKVTGKADEVSIGGYSFDYRIVNKQGETVAGSEPFKGTRTIYFRQGPPSEIGTASWHGAYSTSSQPEELFFVLDAVQVTEASNFAIQFSPNEINKRPVTLKNEEDGGTYTIKNVSTRTDPVSNEKLTIILIEGQLLESEFPNWNLTDENGKRYETEIDFENVFTEGNESQTKLVEPLIVKGLPDHPGELTLSMQTIQKRYTNENWKVPIPPNTVINPPASK
ncbi:DUF4179 domain-containing protein [Brevibacillus sp. SYSU BS000544]|uniref:DUF4179 domain-containing protein n=1 Tax=Brevibacillus sp. SYSU BS000544 TaxID=3416443 RepID=UPI003CE56BBA